MDYIECIDSNLAPLNPRSHRIPRMSRRNSDGWVQRTTFELTAAQAQSFSFPLFNKVKGSVLSMQQFRQVKGQFSFTPSTL